MSGLLLDERLLCYQPALVRRIGLAEAAIVQQLHYWAQRSTHTHDGERYVYKTYGDWSDEIGISAKAIRGACDRLRRDGILVAIQSPLDSRDRTLWWRINYAALDGDGSGAPSAPTGRPDAAGGSSHARDRGGTESTSETGGGDARAKAKIPEDFPPSLRPHLERVYVILRAVAWERPNTPAIVPMALARVLMARPHKCLVKEAHDYAAWCAEKGYPHRNVVSGYRNRLDNSPTIAGVEVMPEHEQPGQTSANVTPIRAGRYDARAAKADREASREAAARRLLAQQQPSA